VVCFFERNWDGVDKEKRREKKSEGGVSCRLFFSFYFVEISPRLRPLSLSFILKKNGSKLTAPKGA
jgi:hypothetical protein